MAFNVRVQSKRDTHANWTSNNPVILQGEIILVDIDGEVRAKVGNGNSRYTDLDFIDQVIRDAIEAHEDGIVASLDGMHGMRMNEENKSLDFLSADATTMYQIPLYIAD